MSIVPNSVERITAPIEICHDYLPEHYIEQKMLYSTPLAAGSGPMS